MKKLAKSFRAELEVRSGVESGVKGFSNIFFLLSIRKEALDIAFRRVERIIKAQFLRK